MANQSVPSTRASEESLIQAGQPGDVQALNTLFHRHQRTLFHSALGIMGNPHDAEDATSRRPMMAAVISVVLTPETSVI
jgi:hypothetical protein